MAKLKKTRPKTCNVLGRELLKVLSKIMPQTLVKNQRKEALELADRVTIASVLTWDAIAKTYSPEEIETICIEGDIVWVKLVDGAYPIARHTFRSILEAQRDSINKQIERVVNTKAEEVKEATAEPRPEIEWHQMFFNLGIYRGWTM